MVGAANCGSGPLLQWWRILPRAGAWSGLVPRQWLTAGEMYRLPIPFRRSWFLTWPLLAAKEQREHEFEANDEESKTETG